MSWKASLLVRSKVLGLFLNTLTADQMHCRHYLKQTSAKFSSNIISKTESFPQFFITFMQSTPNFAHFEKNISFIAKIFRKLLTQGIVGTWMPESSWRQRVDRYYTLLKSPWQRFNYKFSLILDTLTWETSLLVRSEILGLFGNKLTSDHMYSRRYLRQISGKC